MDIEVKSVVIKFGDKEVALSIEEAKILRDKLDDALGGTLVYRPFGTPVWPIYPQITYIG